MYVKYFKKENYLKEKITSKYRLHFLTNTMYDNSFLGIRKCELMHMRSIGFFDNFCVTFIQNQPVLSLACLFIAFHLNEMPTEIDKKISFIAQIAAVCILILVHLKNSFDNFWSALNNFTKGLVSLQKLKVKLFNALACTKRIICFITGNTDIRIYRKNNFKTTIGTSYCFNGRDFPNSQV